MKLNYYARLKEDNVCIEITSTPKNLDNVKGYIRLPEYNASVLYKKYDAKTGWSAQSYEPQIDAVIQERFDMLESTVASQELQTQELIAERNQLTKIVSDLQELLASFIGGAM